MFWYVVGYTVLFIVVIAFLVLLYTFLRISSSALKEMQKPEYEQSPYSYRDETTDDSYSSGRSPKF